LALVAAPSNVPPVSLQNPQSTIDDQGSGSIVATQLFVDEP
jgi:hypothetical protein